MGKVVTGVELLDQDRKARRGAFIPVPKISSRRVGPEFMRSFKPTRGPL